MCLTCSVAPSQPNLQQGTRVTSSGRPRAGVGIQPGPAPELGPPEIFTVQTRPMGVSVQADFTVRIRAGPQSKRAVIGLLFVAAGPWKPWHGECHLSLVEDPHA